MLAAPITLNLKFAFGVTINLIVGKKDERYRSCVVVLVPRASTYTFFFFLANENQRQNLGISVLAYDRSIPLARTS